MYTATCFYFGSCIFHNLLVKLLFFSFFNNVHITWCPAEFLFKKYDDSRFSSARFLLIFFAYNPFKKTTGTSQSTNTETQRQYVYQSTQNALLYVTALDNRSVAIFLFNLCWVFLCKNKPTYNILSGWGNNLLRWSRKLCVQEDFFHHIYSRYIFFVTSSEWI